MLCDFAHRFPDFSSRFLEQSKRLRRRFREETVTDLMMGSLLSAAGGYVRVEFPDEPTTGADMEWIFINRTRKTYIRLLLQAKQLYGDGTLWQRHCYRELYHQTKSASYPQAKVLADTARSDPATIPLYILYNPSSSCKLANADGARTIKGVNLIDGYIIERFVATAVGRKLRTANRSLKKLHPFMFDLCDLFCPSSFVRLGPLALAGRSKTGMFFLNSNGLGVPVAPRPEDVRQRLSDRREALFENAGDLLGGIEMPDLPQVSDTIPKDLLSLIGESDGQSVSPEDEVPLTHWRVTFLSSDAVDEDARRDT